MTLGCTDVCGTATLEQQKILVEISLSIAFGTNRAASNRKHPVNVARRSKCGDNFKRASRLRCAFRIAPRGSR
jgi:hypothetical protein